MIPLFLAAALGVPVLGAAGSSLDVGNLIASYGIAAPFAGLCLWQMQRTQRKLDEELAKNEKLQAEAVANARDLASRFGPLLYDSALLYRQGNERLAQGLSQPQESEVRRLAEEVERLIRRIEGP